MNRADFKKLVGMATVVGGIHYIQRRRLAGNSAPQARCAAVGQALDHVLGGLDPRLRDQVNQVQALIRESTRADHIPHQNPVKDVEFEVLDEKGPAS